MEHRPRSRLVLTKKERSAEEKQMLLPANAVCLTKNGGIWKRDFNYVERPVSAPSIRTRNGLERVAEELEAPVV